MAKWINKVRDRAPKLRMIIIDSGVEHCDTNALASGVSGHLAEIPHHVLPGIVRYLRARIGRIARRGVGRTRRASYQHAGGESRQSDKY